MLTFYSLSNYTFFTGCPQVSYLSLKVLSLILQKLFIGNPFLGFIKIRCVQYFPFSKWVIVISFLLLLKPLRKTEKKEMVLFNITLQIKVQYFKNIYLRLGVSLMNYIFKYHTFSHFHFFHPHVTISIKMEGTFMLHLRADWCLLGSPKGFNKECSLPCWEIGTKESQIKCTISG